MTAPTFLAILTSHPPPSVGQVTIGPSRDPVPHDGKRLPGSPLPRRATVVRPKSRATAAPPAPAIAGTPDWLGVRPRIDGDLAQARRRLATLGGGDDEVRALLEPVRAALDDLGAAFPALVAQADAFAEAVAGAADREELKALGRELAGEERLLRLSVKEQLLGNRVRQEAAPVRGRKQAEPQDHPMGPPMSSVPSTRSCCSASTRSGWLPVSIQSNPFRSHRRRPLRQCDVAPPGRQSSVTCGRGGERPPPRRPRLHIAQVPPPPAASALAGLDARRVA